MHAGSLVMPPNPAVNPTRRAAAGYFPLVSQMTQHSAADRVVAALRRVLAVLRPTGTPWVPRLEALLLRLADPTSRGKAVAELRTLFGGMGSLNDIVLCEANGNLPPGWSEARANRRLGRALDTLFRESTLFGEPWGARVWWSFAARSLRPELPPRIRYAFRRDNGETR